VFCVTDGKPTTAEGNLLRVRREMLGLTAERASEGTPIGRSKWGDVERGRTRAARGRPAEEWHARKADVAIMATRLGVTPDELRQAGRADAAEILERETAGRARTIPQPFAPAPIADAGVVDQLFAALTASRPDREVLEFLWRALDGDGNLKPLAERVRSVADWADGGRRSRSAERPAETA
jgi:hypothetical protein